MNIATTPSGATVSYRSVGATGEWTSVGVSPIPNKRYIAYDTGHNIPRPDLIRESLKWFDTYLGPTQ